MKQRIVTPKETKALQQRGKSLFRKTKGIKVNTLRKPRMRRSR